MKLVDENFSGVREREIVIVHVIPSCMSCGREAQYIRQTIEAYLTGTLKGNMEIVSKSNEQVIINFYR